MERVRHRRPTTPGRLSWRRAWPQNKATANIGVVNEGIGGNRLLTDATGLAGVSALARLDRDALSHPGVKWLMILEGINDIGTLASTTNTTEPVTKENLIWVLQQVIDRAHAHGIKVIGCTLTPYEGAGYSRENGEAIRDRRQSMDPNLAGVRCSGRFRSSHARSKQPEALQA